MPIARSAAVLRVPLALLAAVALAGAEEAVSWAELPHWPIGLAPADTTGTGKNKPKARILAWIPDGCEHPRVVLLVPNNSDCKDFAQHAKLREVARKHAMAIVYMRTYPAKSFVPDPAAPVDARQQVLDDVAAATGKSEFRHAPWVVFGKSSVGPFPIQTDWNFPDRVVASVIYHGETPGWPIPPTAKLAGQTILHLNLNGETEWGGTWFRHVRPALLNYRAQQHWLAHQAIARGVGHGDYADAAGSPGWGIDQPGRVTCIRVWDYLSLFIDKALALRMPPDGVPIDGPLTLRTVDEAGGVLIDPFAIEEILRVARFPLVEKPEGFALGDGSEPAVTGYAHLTPPSEAVPEGVPVVPVPLGHSPKAWLLAGPLAKVIATDPISDPSAWTGLRPKPGDTLDLEGTTFTWKPLEAKNVNENGGIKLGGLKGQGKPVTLLGYTVIEVPEPAAYLLRAPFSPAGRLQVVIDGQPVEHKQVVELDAGRHPMLIVLRLNAAWGSVEPWLDPVTPEDVATGKSLAGERARRAAEAERLRTTPRAPTASFIKPAASVPTAERARMFWVPDQEMADAWVALHELKPADPVAAPPAR